MPQCGAPALAIGPETRQARAGHQKDPALLEAAGKLEVIELDRDLIPGLRVQFFNYPDFVIHEGDALRFDFPGLVGDGPALRVDETARVTGPEGRYDNIWTAGEMMAGSILGQGYLAGFGMTIGTVFGRIAGQEAAAHVA